MEFILGVAIFIADIWAIVNIFRSEGTTAVGKLIWMLLILILPVVGLIIWFFAGPARSQNTPVVQRSFFFEIIIYIWFKIWGSFFSAASAFSVLNFHA